MRSCDGRRSKQQHILWNKLPCLGKPAAKTDDHTLSFCLYQTRMKKVLTHPKLLFIWPWRWMSTLCLFDSSVKQLAWATFLYPAEWRATLCWYHYPVQLRWMICSLVWSQKRDWQNKTLAWVLQGCVWGGWKHPCTHLTWFVWNQKMKGAL